MSEFITGILWLLNTNTLMPGFTGMVLSILISVMVTKKTDELMVILLPISLVMNFALRVNVSMPFIYACGVMFVIGLGKTDIGDSLRSSLTTSADKAKKKAENSQWNRRMKQIAKIREDTERKMTEMRRREMLKATGQRKRMELAVLDEELKRRRKARYAT